MAQKSLPLLMLMVVIAIISGCASSPTRKDALIAAVGQKKEAVSAPAPTVTYTPVGCKGGPKYFDSAKDCEVAMQSGECSYYSPSYIGGKGRNPVDNMTKVRVPLEKEACVKMHVVGAWSWVPQKEGDLLRFRKKMDGTLEEVPYARDDCGNEVLEIVYPQPKKVVTTPPAPAQRNICVEKGYSGEEYFNGIDPKTGNLDCLYVVEESFWDTKIGTAVKVVGVVAVVGAVVYCASTHRCGFWKKPSPTPSTTPPTAGPVGSPPISTSGPIGSNPFGGPIGGWPTP